MSLEEAKNQIAKVYKYDTFKELFIDNKSDSMYIKMILSEAAELYCLEERKRVWKEACEAQRLLIEKKWLSGEYGYVSDLLSQEWHEEAEFKP